VDPLDLKENLGYKVSQDLLVQRETEVTKEMQVKREMRDQEV